MKVPKYRSTLLLIPVLATAIVHSHAHAQPPLEAAPDSAAVTTPDGHRWGSFLLRPELGLSLVYDSNIFATRSGEVDDTVTLLSPGLELNSQWERHQLKLSAGATAAYYQDTGSEDYRDYWTELEGRYDLSGNTNAFGGLGFSRDHEDRGSPDDTLAGDEPTRFDSRRAHGGIAHQWGAFGLRLGGTFESLDYQNQGTLHNDDRDRDLTGFGARLSYRLGPRYTVFGQAIRDLRRYDLAQDDQGYDRDSQGHRLAVGFTGIFTNRLSGSAYVGQLRQSYDDARFTEVREPDLNGRLTFRATPATRLVAALERTLEETTLPGASGYLHTSASLQAIHQIDPRLRASAGVSAGRADFQGIAREDELYSADVGLRYLLTPRLYLAASYRVMTRGSNQREAALNDANLQNLDDYARQQVFLTLGTLLYPAQDNGLLGLAGQDRLPLAPMDWAGWYLGAQLAHGSTGIENIGLRGGSGSDEGQFAEAGTGAGLFIGYGLDFDRWYLGLEAELERAATDLYHRKDKTESRTLDIERGEAYGLGLRGGYRLAGGELLYLRLARMRTDFDTYYTLNDAPQDAVDRTFTRDGTRYGIGADIPAGRHLFLRLDYSHTDSDDFDVDLVTEVENLEPVESYFRLGLGWQFGGNEAAPMALSGVAVDGFHAGAQLSHGGLNSHLSGSHLDGGGGPFDFRGDFGHTTGFGGGAFAGWGGLWNRWYLGAEATLEASHADWTHVRDPNGRNFAVARKEGYGLGLRGGYLLQGGTLLYVRADRLRSRFATEWSKGGNRDNDIDRDDRRHGTRIGVGVDLPVTRSLFARLDYSYTDYDSYAFTTAHGNADNMSFANSETLFRLGLGVRF